MRLFWRLRLKTVVLVLLVVVCCSALYALRLGSPSSAEEAVWLKREARGEGWRSEGVVREVRGEGWRREEVVGDVVDIRQEDGDNWRGEKKSHHEEGEWRVHGKALKMAEGDPVSQRREEGERGRGEMGEVVGREVGEGVRWEVGDGARRREVGEEVRREVGEGVRREVEDGVRRREVGDEVRREVGNGVRRIGVGEGVMEGRRKYEPGWRGGERGRAEVPVVREKIESDQYQRRLFSESHRLSDADLSRASKPPLPDGTDKSSPAIRLISQERQDGRGQRVRRSAPWSRVINEEGFPRTRTFEVDLGNFDPEKYLAGQHLEGGADKMRRFQFNQQESEVTPYDRELKDVRNPSCTSSQEDYQTGLSSTSIIICFHNEARSALLRTIFSVLSRSPPELITEIILVDDFSDDSDDGWPLGAIPKVRLVRMEKRSGLMRARVKGAELAVGPILTFLDSHCEVTPGWLEPLLSRLKANHTHVVSPIIDIINKETMQYICASPIVKGGFRHNLHFRWDQMTPGEVQSRTRMIDPIRTAAIAGGLFAVQKAWFQHLGMYDTEMEIWGGENIELSLRVWMCGGELEIIPCSHVGHIFRSAMPYTFGPGGSYESTVAKNIRRTAEVWLDEYKPFFYEQNPFARGVEYGDVSDRLALRHKLQCKSFSWYLRNIYPQFDPPALQDFTYGQLRHGDVCLDTLGRHSMQPPELRPCDPNKTGIGGTQGWAITKSHGIKSHPLCLTFDIGKFYLTTCQSNHKQLFHRYDNGIIQHGPTNSCLTVRGSLLHLDPCDPSDHTQYWDFIVSTVSDTSPLKPLGSN